MSSLGHYCHFKAINAELYNSFEQQKSVIDKMSDEQKIDSQVSSNKFKYQQEQIEHLSKDLESAQQQIKDQNDALYLTKKDAFLQEVEKRHQIENESKSIQTSLVDIKAESDAIKQDMKGWQKDYVTVLAELEKKMDDSQDEIKSLEDNLTALNIPELKENINSLKADIEKMTHPPDNSVGRPARLAKPDKKVEHIQYQSQ